jgi:hypothetical protein
MALSSIIGEVLQRFHKNGRINTDNAIKSAKKLVRKDDEAVEDCIDDAVSRRITNAATRAKRAKSGQDQPSFFGDELRQSYAVDTEGREIVDTDFLSRLQFNRLISIREKQFIDDRRHLDVLRRANRMLSPIWDRMPGATYGEVEREYLRLLREGEIEGEEGAAA